eukprot:4787389-Prymnesium_polylepis.1
MATGGPRDARASVPVDRRRPIARMPCLYIGHCACLYPLGRAICHGAVQAATHYYLRDCVRSRHIATRRPKGGLQGWLTSSVTYFS